MVGATGDDRVEGVAGRLAPEVVDHHVHVLASLAQLLRDGLRVIVESDGGVSPELRKPVCAASDRDDATGVEPSGDLDGESSGVPGRSHDHHALAWLEVDPAAQGDPGRHGRVHGGGDLDGVCAFGKPDAAADVDDGLLRHRSQAGVGEDEVAQGAVGRASDAVDAGDERQVVGAGVVRAFGLGAYPRVDSRGDDVDHHLVRAELIGEGEVLVVGGLVEGGDYSGFHGSSWI